MGLSAKMMKQGRELGCIYNRGPKSALEPWSGQHLQDFKVEFWRHMGLQSVGWRKTQSSRQMWCLKGKEALSRW